MFLINRFVTNKIRFFMDYFIPPFIRDSKLFMYPFFFIFFKGKNISKAMNFKSIVFKMNDDEITNFYRKIKCIANDRETDLNKKCVLKIQNSIEEGENIIDIACGRGGLLKHLKKTKNCHLTGLDVFDDLNIKGIQYQKGNIYKTNCKDNSFDTVISTHILEHLIDCKKAILELKRIAKIKLIICVPKQRYYYYTLDLHLNFFPYKEKLIHLNRK